MNHHDSKMKNPQVKLKPNPTKIYRKKKNKSGTLKLPLWAGFGEKRPQRYMIRKKKSAFDDTAQIIEMQKSKKQKFRQVQIQTEQQLK